MLKMIIVDDEYLERNGLAKSMDWGNIGIEIAGLYDNGKAALNAILQNKPDILLTDIKMPIMDGLTLAQKVREIDQIIKIIFISGYEDFQYAKKAIELNASEYILKPFVLDDLENFFKEIAKKCEDEKKSLHDQSIMMQKLEESLPYLSDRFYFDLLMGIHTDEEYVKGRIKFLDIPLQINGIYYANALEIDYWHKYEVKNLDKYYQTLSVFILAKIREKLAGNYGVCININESVYGIIISYDRVSNHEKENIILMEVIQKELQEYFKVDITIGVSKPTCQAIHLNMAFKQAREAARQKFTIGTNQIIHYEDIATRNSIEFGSIINESRDSLLTMISIGDSSGIAKLVDILFAALLEATSDIRYIQSICIDIINKASIVLLNKSYDMKESAGSIESLLVNLLEFDTAYALQHWIKSKLTAIADYIGQKSCSRSNRIVEQIKDVIKNRYAEELTIADVVKEIYLSAGYATQLFKKETGISIIDYIIQTRIDTAKELLKDPGSKINEVSQKIGYENITYFCSLFKNAVGVSPKEYRDKLGG